MFQKMHTIYIGYDPKQNVYVDMLKKSIELNTKEKYNIVPLVQSELRRAGMYRRGTEVVDGVEVDQFDRKPFSSEFSFTRFLVPFLNQRSGLALFMDADMFVRADISEIFNIYGRDTSKAIHCVKHDYWPKESSKRDGKVQTVYFRKNWSSFVLWNCAHPAHDELSVCDVNYRSGSWLHSFQWLESEVIGDLPSKWNWLDSHDEPTVGANNVHFTTGGPLYAGWKGPREVDNEYANEWRAFAKKHSVEQPYY